MNYCQFYLISSKKSKEIVNGLKKIIFGCKNRADAYGFIWIDNIEKIQQIQLIFGELVIEWLPLQGIRFSRTNRDLDTPDGIGFQKGVRILHPIENKTEIESILEEANNATYPSEWSEKILEKL